MLKSAKIKRKSGIFHPLFFALTKLLHKLTNYKLSAKSFFFFFLEIGFERNSYAFFNASALFSVVSSVLLIHFELSPEL